VRGSWAVENIDGPDTTLFAMADAPDDTRIDKWLWAARFFKTRSQATAAVTGGKVEVNGDTAKPSKVIKVGDRIRLRLGPAEYRLTVTAIGERRGSAAVAQTLYEEAADSVAERQRIASERRFSSAPSYEEKGRPSKKDRRDLERWRRDR
jgi:ribosome-associated heat shock protein Hsp15